jgi:hypothetical protein
LFHVFNFFTFLFPVWFVSVYIFCLLLLFTNVSVWGSFYLLFFGLVLISLFTLFNKAFVKGECSFFPSLYIPIYIYIYIYLFLTLVFV